MSPPHKDHVLVRNPIPAAGDAPGRRPVWADVGVLPAAGPAGGLRLHEQLPPGQRALFDALVWVIRGTPLVLQLIIIFYGPGLWFGHNIWGSNRMLAVPWPLY